MESARFKKGYSLPEMLVYVALLTSLLVVIVNVFLFVSASYRVIRADREIETSATAALERFMREARAAGAVDAASALGSSPGTLVLAAQDAGPADPKTYIWLEDGAVWTRLGTGATERLTTAAVTAVSLSFEKFAAGTSEGVRATLSLESEDPKAYKAETFYATAVLRGSY